MSHDLSLYQLGRTIQAHIHAGDKASEKSEQQYKSAGLYLIEAKKMAKLEGIKWDDYLRSNVKISRRRSYELMKIANGTATLDKLQAENRARQQKHRARLALQKPDSADAVCVTSRTSLPNDYEHSHEPDREAIIRRIASDLICLKTSTLQRLASYVQSKREASQHTTATDTLSDGHS